uniref:Ig-like domain-containing protein n=1 Tax=Panagrolaimus sp. JU765 TaxID=591449 RepID=A0AC34QN18_9BILA
MDQRKVHLLYEVRETGRSNLNEVPVDSHMGELALSLAITPSIEDRLLDLTVIDPNDTLRVYTGLNVKGVYECRADNVAGTASDFSTVNIAEKPIINIPRQEYVLGQGENVVLQCNVLGGQPTPKVHWEKNGVLFTTEGIGSSNYIQQKYGNLHIKGASEIDAGEYTCVAENSAGKDSKKTRVNIGIPPNIIISPPKIEATIFKPTH